MTTKSNAELFSSHNVTSILRWMGANGYETGAAAGTIFVLLPKKEHPSITTVRAQVSAGRKATRGQCPRGPIPKLTKQQESAIARAYREYYAKESAE